MFPRIGYCLSYVHQKVTTTLSKMILSIMKIKQVTTMKQRALKNVNSSRDTKITFYLETSGGQNSNLHLNIVYFFNTSVNETSVAA